MTKRSFRKRHKIRKKTFILKSKYFWFSLIFLFLFFICFYFLFFWNKIQIKEISVVGNEKIDAEEIKKVVFDNIERRIFFKDSKSILAFRTGKLEGEILSNFLEIEKVKINRSFPDSLNVKIKEREEVAFFCSQGECFNVDEKGIIFEKINESEVPRSKEIGMMGIQEMDLSNQEVSPTEEKLIIRLSEEKGDVILGEKIIEEDIFNIIFKIEEKFEENNLQIKIEKVVVERNKKLDVITNENWEIYFNLEKNIELQILQLILLLKREILPEERKELEYIDLRFSRAYYK